MCKADPDSSGTCLDCILWGIKSPLGLKFFLHSSMFQLHVSDFLCLQVLASLQVPSGIELNIYIHDPRSAIVIICASLL